MSTKTRLTTHLYQYSGVFFIVFLVSALIAFWPGYFSHPLSGIKPYLHFHGLTMTLWCIMLITQALLIRFKKYPAHRAIGKASYVLMPLLLIAGFHTAHVTVSEMPSGLNTYYSAVALMFNSLILVATFYTLAIYNKNRPTIHARWMVCTVVPMFTPVTDRLTYIHFPSLLQHVPTIDGSPMVVLYGFGLANTILLILAILDLQSRPRIPVFLVALILSLIYDLTVVKLYNTSLWRSIADWIMSLPLS